MDKKRVIYVLIDKDGHQQDKNGSPYGWYPDYEKELCEQYCQKTGLTYTEKVVTVW